MSTIRIVVSTITVVIVTLMIMIVILSLLSLLSPSPTANVLAMLPISKTEGYAADISAIIQFLYPKLGSFFDMEYYF